jgi:hypothetical protein
MRMEALKVADWDLTDLAFALDLEPDHSFEQS